MQFVNRGGERAHPHTPNTLTLTLVSVIDRRPQIQTRHRRRIGPGNERPIVGQRLDSFLPARPKARCIELTAFETAHPIDLVGDAIADAPKEAGAVFSPGRWDNRFLDFGARRAVIEGGFVKLIHKTHGNQNQANAEIQRVRVQVVEVEKFHKDIAATTVLEFDF